jgi:CubicO group peptidase (beta-lactamase class C family)/chromosome segregation ATPase
MNRSKRREAALVLAVAVALAPMAARGATWPVGDPAAHAVEPTRLKSAADRIGQLPGVDGLLVAHRGELVVERYFRDGAADHPHNLKSASKSVLSALAGIAIEEGLLGLDQPIAELLPRSAALADPAKRAITVRHLLTMTTGLEPTSYDTYNEWIQSRDWVESALSRPLVAEPGTFYQYSTGTTHILSAVLASASGMTTRQYAERKLFGPLGIEIKGWQRDPAGTYVGGNNLSLLPRDMLRFGQLYLDGGRFGDRQILPAAWVEESTRTGQSGLHVVYGTYGYLWWTDLFYRGAFSAVGYGGQYIYVSPAHDAVVVVTSTLESKGLEWTRRLYALLRNGILASFEPSADYFAARGRAPIDPALDSLTQALAATEAEVANLRDELAELPPAAARGRTTSRVNLREQPDTAARRLSVLERGIAFDVLERSGAWLRVRTVDREGWLHSDYVRLNEETTWRATLAPLGAELASFVSAARRALRADSEASGEADPAGDDQVPLRLDGPDPVFAAEEGEVSRLTGRAGEFDAQPETRTETRLAAGPASGGSSADRATITALVADKARMEQELEAARQELAARANALDEVRDEREALRAELVAAQAAGRQLTPLGEERDRALASLTEARSRIQTLEQQVAKDATSARERADELVADLGEAVERATAAEARTARAQSSAQTAALERDRLAGELEAQRHDRSTAEQAAEAQARSRQEEISRLGAELETARSQNAALAESLQKEKEAGVEGASERDRLEAELAAARERLSGELSERQLDSAALEALEQERDRLAADLESTRQAQGRSVRELETLRRAQEESRAGLEAQVETARTQASTLAEELQKTKRELGETESERQRLATDLAAARDRMNDEVRTERAKAAELQTGLEAAQAAAATLAQERDGLAAELDEARREIQRVGETSAVAQGEGQRLAAELEASRQALDRLRGELAEARNLGEATSTHSSEVSEELASARRELEAERTEARRLAAELDTAQSALEESQGALTELRAVSQDASQTSTSLASELAAARSRTTAAEGQAAAAEDRAVNAETRAQTQESRAEGAEAERDELAAQLAAATAQLAAATDDLAAATDQVATTTQQAEAASSRAADLERTRRQIAAQLEVAQEARRKAEEGGRSSSSELEDRIAQLTNELAEESTESEAARSALGESAAELDRARQELARARDATATVASERDTAVERVAVLEAQARELQQAVADTRRQLAEAEQPAPTPAPRPAPQPDPRLADLEQALAQSEVTSREQARELDGLRRELTSQRNELADAVTDRTQLADALAAARATSDRLERRIAELEEAATAARSAAAPRADASGIAGGRGGVQGFVRSWAEALSRRDLDRFLSFYSRSFEPPSGLTLRTWGERRVAALADPSIRGLELGSVEVAPLSSGGASTRFVYRLKTSERDITMTKTLELVWEGGGWKILREAPLLR